MHCACRESSLSACFGYKILSSAFLSTFISFFGQIKYKIIKDGWILLISNYTYVCVYLFFDCYTILLRLLRSFSFGYMHFFSANIFIYFVSLNCVCVRARFFLAKTIFFAFSHSVFVIFIGKQWLPISVLRRDFMYDEKKKYLHKRFRTYGIHCNAFSLRSCICWMKIKRRNRGVLLLHVNIDMGRDEKWLGAQIFWSWNRRNAKT